MTSLVQYDSYYYEIIDSFSCTDTFDFGSPNCLFDAFKTQKRPGTHRKRDDLNIFETFRPFLLKDLKR
jgi:hypothetical protein